MSCFISAISSRKLIELNKHSSRGCFSLVLICQLSRLKQCGLSVLLRNTTTGFEPWIVVSRSRHLTHVTNMLNIVVYISLISMLSAFANKMLYIVIVFQRFIHKHVLTIYLIPRFTKIPIYQDTKIPRYQDTKIPRYQDTKITQTCSHDLSDTKIIQ